MGLVGLALAAGAEQAAAQHRDRGFWIALDLGYGALRISADRSPGQRQVTEAQSVKAGASLSRHLRLGGQVDAWGIESYAVNDPSKGVGVTNVLAVTQFYPSTRAGLFLKTGVGFALYHNLHPPSVDSTAYPGQGFAWTLGVGYDVTVRKSVCLTPAVNYSSGTLGSVQNRWVTITNRRFDVVDVALGITYC